MRIKYMLLLLASLSFFGTTCQKENTECHKTIAISNNSDISIYVICDTHYPDTLYFGHFSSPISDPYTYKILPKSISDRPLQNRDCWESVFNYGVQIPSDTLMVYFFDAAVIENEEWNSVVHGYKILKRYDLSLDDLKRTNWAVTYP